MNAGRPRVRLGAVGYLNARPHVYGLEHDARFDLRFDVPSRCAELLHAGAIDVGLVPSIEYQHGTYAVVPEVAIGSAGPVASVAIYTTRPMREVRSIALDTSSRTSVALTRVLCEREFGIAPAFEPHGPDLPSMLARADAALIIGDVALFLEAPQVEKIDLGEVWTRTTGLPFVYAFWAGRPGALDAADVKRLQRARDAGVQNLGDVCRAYFGDDPSRQRVGLEYLRDNIRYDLGESERAGLERFYTYAAEAGVIGEHQPLRFYP
jgi:chorismate dehydratase